ncbi:MAG: glycosyltransferase [Anaerolineae bacterium]|nr:glycosyltransferase [Anaerolineae bacterium]
MINVTAIVPVFNEEHLVKSSLSRLLALNFPHGAISQVILVDDGSTDDSLAVLQSIASEDARILLIQHPKNIGKGAAIRSALPHATGDVCLVHDADLEYNPADIPNLLQPFLDEGADAVFGSRFMAGSYRRALMYRHAWVNRVLTGLVCWFTDLYLTDVETSYKAIRTELLKSLPIRANDFRVEIELTMKLAKRRARIFEVPIRYSPRSYEEGKKVRAKDGFLALLAILRNWIIDDIYQQDAYGSNILNDLQDARRFNQWMGDTLRPYIGDRVIEVGCGIGTLTNQFIPRDHYLAADINPHYLRYMQAYAMGKPYLQVAYMDATNHADFASHAQKFDTAMMINVLEHVSDEQAALGNLSHVLKSGGRCVILVPQHPKLYGTLDVVLEHRERYTADGLRASLEKAGFQVERIFDFNRVSVLGWWLNGKILKKSSFSRVQIKILEMLMPFIRRLDRFLPYRGISVIGIGVKP